MSDPQQKEIITNEQFEAARYHARRLELNALEKRLKKDGLLKDDEEILQWEDTHPQKWTTQYRQLFIFLLLFSGLTLLFIENQVGTEKLIGIIAKSFAVVLVAFIAWGFAKKLWK